jgi:hypothetical protein
LFDFPSTKYTQKKYFPHINYENYEINFIKIDIKGFSTTPRIPQIPIQFSIPILLNFHEKMVQ